MTDPSPVSALHDCGEGCLHPSLTVRVPSLDYEVCVGDDGQDLPHLHMTLHRHDEDERSVPAMHLDRPETSLAPDDEDSHAIETAEWLALLAHVVSLDTSGRVTLVSAETGVELGGWVDPEDALAALQDYTEVGDAVLDLVLDAPD